MINSDNKVVRVDFKSGAVTPGALCVAFDDQRTAPVVGPLANKVVGRADHLSPQVNVVDFRLDLKNPTGISVAVCRAIARALPAEEAALLMGYYRISAGRDGPASADDLLKINAGLRALRKAS